MPRRPNVLWILTDEQRADSLACNGAGWPVSPHLDALAARGVRYTAACTPSPVSVAARVALLSGRAPQITRVRHNQHRLAVGHPPFLTWTFAAAGYQTASFGKHHYNSPQAAFETQRGSGTDESVKPEGYRVAVDPVAYGVVQYPLPARRWILAGRFPGTVEQTAELRLVREGLDWLRQRDRGRPFLLRISLLAPHTPVVAPAPFDTLIDPARIDLPLDAPEAAGQPAPVGAALVPWAGVQRLSVSQLQRARQCYYGRCALVDHAVGELLTAMQASGDLDGTLVAFCSDHGAHLGEHGFLQKQSLYEPAVRVPLLLAGPDLPVGEVVDQPLNLGCLLPTLLDRCGLRCPHPVDYQPLDPAGRPVVGAVDSQVELGLWGYRPGEAWTLVRQGTWKLLGYPEPDGSFSDGALYDLASDPREQTNRWHDPACEPQRAMLLAAWRARCDDLASRPDPGWAAAEETPCE